MAASKSSRSSSTDRPVGADLGRGALTDVKEDVLRLCEAWAASSKQHFGRKTTISKLNPTPVQTRSTKVVGLPSLTFCMHQNCLRPCGSSSHCFIILSTVILSSSIQTSLQSASYDVTLARSSFCFTDCRFDDFKLHESTWNRFCLFHSRLLRLLCECELDH